MVNTNEKFKSQFSDMLKTKRRFSSRVFHRIGRKYSRNSKSRSSLFIQGSEFKHFCQILCFAFKSAGLCDEPWTH